MKTSRQTLDSLAKRDEDRLSIFSILKSPSFILFPLLLISKGVFDFPSNLGTLLITALLAVPCCIWLFTYSVPGKETNTYVKIMGKYIKNPNGFARKIGKTITPIDNPSDLYGAKGEVFLSCVSISKSNPIENKKLLWDEAKNSGIQCRVLTERIICRPSKKLEEKDFLGKIDYSGNCPHFSMKGIVLLEKIIEITEIFKIEK
jgi:hypothetical protein